MLAIAIVALVLSLASVALQVYRWTPAPASPPAGAATGSPSASAPPAVTPSPVAVASATPGPAVPVVPAPTTRRAAPPPPPPATQGPPCIVGLWTLMSSQEYVSIDNTPPDELRYTAGTKQISYGVGGSGTVSYQDHSRFATASDDGSEWHYLTITEFASFDYGVSSGRITHTLKSKSGQLRIFHNGVQQFDGPPGDPFYAGAQTMTCTATTLRVTAPAFVETYRRS